VKPTQGEEPSGEDIHYIGPGALSKEQIDIHIIRRYLDNTPRKSITDKQERDLAIASLDRLALIADRPVPTAEKGQDEKNKTALLKINDIRNSIIGFQKINWSEHIYPLVAALDEAGIEGMGYPKAREYYGSLMERCNKAEAAEKGLREALDAIDFYINNGDALPKNKSDPYYAADAAIEVFRAALLAREAPGVDLGYPYD
jgi:hypothetical protein